MVNKSTTQDDKTPVAKEATPTKKAAPKSKKSAPKSKKKAAPKAKKSATKSKKASPSTAKTVPVKRSRGKRYSTKEKAEILTFVDKHNAANGRGGAAAASRHYKVSQLTIGNWLKEAGSPAPRRKKSSADISQTLVRLGKIHKTMAKVEEELDGLRKEYAALKALL